MSIWTYLKTCLVKGCKNEVDFQGHHIIHRGSGGSDGPWNRLKVCRIHHNEAHDIGEDGFLSNHPELKFWVERGKRIERVWQKEKTGKLENLSEEERDILKYIQKVRKFYSTVSS